MTIFGIRTKTTTVTGLVVVIAMILMSAAQAQVHHSEPYAPIDWPSKPPADCP